jgi:hypothetical protein
MTLAGTWEEQVDFVRGMSPAAAKILWILLLSGRSLTNKDLIFTCDMSDKTIQHGLEWLEFKGLVQNNGKFNGWSLTAAVRQLPLPFAALPGEGEAVASLDGECRKISGFLSSSSSSLQTLKDLAGNEGEEEPRESRKISGFPPRTTRAQIRQCLIDAGVGGRSQKLHEILNLDLDLDFVKSHIAARKTKLDNGDEYPVNWLITKLLDGDPVPVVRLTACPDCGSPHFWSAKEQICLRCEGIVKT